MNEAVKKFILLVEVHFPRQKFSGDEAKEAIWLRDMSELLGQYSYEVLSEAAATIVRTRDPEKNGTMFPKPLECIRTCDQIQRRKMLDNLPMFSGGGEEIRQLSAPQNLPSFRISRGDTGWKAWLAHFESHGQKDLAQAADMLGYVQASSRYPNATSIVFEPKASGQYAFAQLRAMN